MELTSGLLHAFLTVRRRQMPSVELSLNELKVLHDALEAFIESVRAAGKTASAA